MQAYGSQSSASAYMPSTGFYNGSSSQSPYGVLSPATYTTMGVAGHTAGTRALSQQCKNGQSLGIISTPKMADANRPITFLLSNTAQTPPYLSSYGSAFGSVGTNSSSPSGPAAYASAYSSAAAYNSATAAQSFSNSQQVPTVCITILYQLDYSLYRMIV